MKNYCLESEIVELIGEDAAFALAEQFAGTRLYIPQKRRASNPLDCAIGSEAAGKLFEHFGAATIKVPLMRDRRAARLRAAGLSHAKIALRLGMTETSVTKLLKRVGGKRPIIVSERFLKGR